MSRQHSWLIAFVVIAAMLVGSCTTSPAAAPAVATVAAAVPTIAAAVPTVAAPAVATVAAAAPTVAAAAAATVAAVAPTVAAAAGATTAPTAAVAPTVTVTTTAAPAASGPATWIQKTPQEMGCKYGANGKCKVVLSNSFIGNDWRIQMQNTAKAAAQYEPFKSTFDFSILNTEYSAEAQNAALDNLLVQGVDIVLLDAYSPSAHNDWIKRATDKGVTVVSFDIVTDSPLDYKVESDFPQAARVAGRWFAKALNCKGKIAMDLGLQATQIAEQIANGGRQGFKDACGDNNQIEEVATFYGQFAEGPMEPAISSILATQPKLDGVFTQGYCTTVISAYESAGRLDTDKPVLYCQGYNSNFVLLAQGKAKGVISANSPATSIHAMQLAYELRSGEKVQKYNPYELGTYATDTSIDVGVPYEKIELGKNAFTDMPGGFSPAYNITNSPPNPKIWVQITLDDLKKAAATK
jgi:ribose transport system substrate-binding protein